MDESESLTEKAPQQPEQQSAGEGPLPVSTAPGKEDPVQPESELTAKGKEYAGQSEESVEPPQLTPRQHINIEPVAPTPSSDRRDAQSSKAFLDVSPERRAVQSSGEGMFQAEENAPTDEAMPMEQGEDQEVTDQPAPGDDDACTEESTVKIDNFGRSKLHSHHFSQMDSLSTIVKMYHFPRRTKETPTIWGRGHSAAQEAEEESVARCQAMRHQELVCKPDLTFSKRVWFRQK